MVLSNYSYFTILGVRSLANASRARQFNPLNPLGWGGYRFLKQIWQPWSVVRGRARSCAVVRAWSVMRGRALSCVVVRGSLQDVSARIRFGQKNMDVSAKSMDDSAKKDERFGQKRWTFRPNIIIIMAGMAVV